MSDYDNRRADAYKDRLRVIHEMTKAPGAAVSIREQIAQLTEPAEFEQIESRALADGAQDDPWAVTAEPTEVPALLDHIDQLEQMLADAQQEARDERAACLDLLHHTIPRLKAQMQQVRAEAWDEGFDAGERDVWEHEHGSYDDPCIPNPYRETGDSDGHR